MNKNKFLLFFLFYFFVSQVELAKEKSFTSGHRFRSIECTTTNESSAYFDLCNLKAYSRTFVGLNIGIALKAKIYKPINVLVVTKYRYGTIYRDVFKVGPFEWCSIVETAVTNPLIKHFLASSKNAKSLMKKCPLEDRIEMRNGSSEGGELAMFPSGLYREEIKITYLNQILLIKVDYEIKSSIKTSF